MDAVVMAGGKGVRFRPFTKYRSKPMIPFLNRPVMEYMIKKLKDAGIRRLIVLLGYLPNMIKDYFEDGQRYGMEIKYIHGNMPYGTAGAVKRATEHLDDTFLVVSTDIITKISFRKFMKFYRDKGGKVSIALSNVEKPYQYGIALLDEEEKIYKFLEKPNKDQVFSNLVNTGIYILKAEIMDLIPHKKMFDFSKDLFPLLLRKSEPIYGYKSSEYWADIGTPLRYLSATHDALRGRISMSKVSSEWDMIKDNGLVLGENCFVHNDVDIDGFAVLGDNVNVGEGSNVSNSVIWSNTEVGSEVSIEESIIGENVRILPDVNIGKGAMIPDNKKVSSNWVL